jgi:pyrroloquinoline quinone biosynthesis protein B
MKLRIATATRNAEGPPGLMLSPDGRDWCSVDGGCAGGTVRPAAVVLTGSVHERVSPLLDLRHGEPINLYATPAVFEHLTQALPLLPVLEQYCGVCWHLLAVAGERQEADFVIASWPQWSFTALHMQTDENHPMHRACGAIALSVRDNVTGKHVVVLPFAPAPSPQGHSAWGDADCIVVCECDADGWDRVHALHAPRKLVLDRTNLSDHDVLAARQRGVEVARAGMALEL